MVHTKAGKKLMESIAAKEDRDTVRALRAVYVRDFDILEKRHDHYVQCKAPNYSQDDLDGEKDWIQAVIHDHLAISAKCDDYLAQTNSRVSSRQAKIHEAERKEKEAELMLQQVEDETRRREEEDAKIREAEDYKRKVESERRQREIRDEIDLQRLSGAIMRQQLNDLTVDDQAVPTRASSVVSGLSRVSRISSHPSIPNNLTLLAQTPAAFAQTSTMTTTAPITRIIATPQPQPSTVVISTAAQSLPMTTPLVGSTSRIPTPTRLFSQPTATIPSTPKVNLFGKLLKAFTPGSLTRSASVPYIPLNAGASNASVTTSITNPTFSTPSSTSVTAQPVMTSQPTSTVYNIVTSPTSVSQVPVSIIPPTTTPVTAPISTSAVPQAPTTTVPPFVPSTSTSVAAPVSSSAAYPFTPVTTAIIHVPTTSNVTHVPVSVPLPPRPSASVPFPSRSSASVPLPPVSSASASSWFSSWRNVGQPNLFGPRQPAQPPSAPPAQPSFAPPAQPPFAPPAQPPSAPPAQPPSAPPAQPPSAPPAQPPSVPPTHPPSFPPAQPPSFPPASSASHAWPPNPPPNTSIQMNTVPTSSIPTRGASRGVSADDVQAGSTLNPQQIPPNLHRDVDDSRAGCRVYKTANLTELVPFSDHRVLQDVGGRIKKPPLPIGSRQSTIFPRYEQVPEPFLDSIRDREGALSTAKRRAGDVAVLKPAKSVSPKLDLATPRGGQPVDVVTNTLA
ncbi:hypothetical protein DAPPUDRAFT_107986 [Daphnia pulex]|uniref:Uncharacterized protein n=1 Tax=Daphnia pulex TaxID=6669 RepID=E9GYS7_DAPPU|nr:hypothetical protein DAPPUDRAFT_107986 [Daphnia pulex]|eukprot:EFX75213.1 hypothetical protein DAPPUDRAFT_107986 [Daphnia pulex]